MNWRHVAFIIGSVILLALLAQFWFSHYVVPAQQIQQKSLVTAPPPTTPPTGPLVEVNDYRVEEIDAYRIAIHYTVANPGDQTARNIRLTVRPWKKIPTPDHPDPNTLADSSPLRSASQLDTISELKPQEKIRRTLTFDRPNGETDPLPPDVQYRETFVIEFDTK